MSTTISQVTDALAKKLSLSADAKQPDIEYHPDRVKWEARTARRLKEDPSLPKTALPEGFPAQLDSPLVWEGKDWKDEKEWVYELTGEDVKEVDDALKHFHTLDRPIGFVSPSTFPLPKLSSTLHRLSTDIHTGRGFSVLRGVPVDSYSREDNIIIYAGLSSHIGSLRGRQDVNGGVLAHIKDLSSKHDLGEIGAPAYTTDKQVFHTDAGDIISLFALAVAKEGGTSKISSSWQVYNYLAKNRPDLIKTLAEPWPCDNFGKGDYTVHPLLFSHDNKIIIQYARRLFTGFLGLPRSATTPPITEAQAEALDTIHFLAEKYALSLDFRKGDIQYINNLSIFHARDGFRDEGVNTRHLLRLWLRNEDLAWKIPADLEPKWKELYYSIKPDEERFALEPEIRIASKGGAKYY
ncbi:hypothetical protein CPB83DRAFT_864089 [Crepidotus variabilis]|uniref:TauD/TfdA-like domain-containing protein n=1 Tax=Crepidotus variabilis TaxID=179855 RepID=A0A9P6E527_9AGAR|nr:hypothetical protein CPB83DRAFT_864089 [Crepidotus variabilis]